jgi:hypothetical protein
MSDIELPQTLLDALRGLIIQARQQASRSFNTLQVHTYWQIGRHIIEFEQDGAARAAYGKKLLAELATALTGEFGKGFDASNLRYMRLFYQAFPNCDAVRHELSWTHYRLLLRVDTPEARCGTCKKPPHRTAAPASSNGRSAPSTTYLRNVGLQQVNDMAPSQIE